jgi:RimJ/RimL family protein N-acetyltransferase
VVTTTQATPPGSRRSLKAPSQDHETSGLGRTGEITPAAGLPYPACFVGYHRLVVLPEYPIETARLTLRPFSPDDFDDLYAYQSRGDVARYLHWEARDHAQVREALEDQCRETTLGAEGEWLTFAVVWREVGKVVGEVGLKWLSQAHRQGETGFVFNPEYQGRGLATEAAESMLALGFGNLGWHRIIGSCDVRNHSSVRLMERIGMRREAHFMHNQIVKGEWTDELIFAILDQEWKARCGPRPAIGRPPRPRGASPRCP